MAAKFLLSLFIVCLFSSHGYAETQAELTSKGMMVEQGKVMMEKGRMMMDHGKVLINEGDKLMKAGMEMMEGKISNRGWWMEEGSLIEKGKMVKSGRETIWKEGDKMIREGLRMIEDTMMIEKGELILKEGILHDVQASLSFAAALASIKMETPGPFGGSLEGVLARMSNRPDVQR